MAQNNKRFLAEIPYSVALTAGIASREFTFKAPNFPTRISHLDSAADAADGTDKPTWAVIVDGTTIITGTAVTAADTVTRITAMDAGKSDLIPANATIKLKLTTAGTAGNVLGLTCRLSTYGVN